MMQYEIDIRQSDTDCDIIADKLIKMDDAVSISLPEERIGNDLDDESPAKITAQKEKPPDTMGRKSNRQPKRLRSYSPTLTTDTQKRKRRKKKRPETERQHDTLPNGKPFCCDLCGSKYVCKPSRKYGSGSAKKSRHMPYPRYHCDPRTGKTLMLCNACGLSLNRIRSSGKKREKPSEKTPDLIQADKEKYQKDAKEFGQYWMQQLNEPLAERLYCPKYINKACGCIQNYIRTSNDTDTDTDTERAQELLVILKEAKKLASLKWYDPSAKGRRGMIGLGFGQRRSQLFEEFVLAERKKLKEGEKLNGMFCLCEMACQRLLCYSNNFLHKKLKTVEGLRRVKRQIGKQQLGLLKPIHELPGQWCCGDQCCRLAFTHGKLLHGWRARAKEGQTSARRVLAEMLTPAGGARPNCYMFIAMVTGCSTSTIARVNEQMKETGGDREPPEHGLKKYWQSKRKKIVKKASKPKSADPVTLFQNQFYQDQVLHHAAISKDVKRVVSSKSILKNISTKRPDVFPDVSTSGILGTTLDGSIIESYQSTSLSNQVPMPEMETPNEMIEIQLAPTYAQSMDQFQVLASNLLSPGQITNSSSGLHNLLTPGDNIDTPPDCLQNTITRNVQHNDVFHVPFSQAISTLAVDTSPVNGEILPRYSDVVSQKKRISNCDVHLGLKKEKDQVGKMIHASAVGLPVVSSSDSPTGGHMSAVAEVFHDNFPSTQTKGFQTDFHVKNSESYSGTILETNENVHIKVSPVKFQSAQQPGSDSNQNILLSNANIKGATVAVLPDLSNMPIQQPLLQYQCLGLGGLAPSQPTTFQVIPGPNGSFHLVPCTNACVQVLPQVFQVVNQLGGASIISEQGQSKTGIAPSSNVNVTQSVANQSCDRTTGMIPCSPCIQNSDTHSSKGSKKDSTENIVRSKDLGLHVPSVTKVANQTTKSNSEGILSQAGQDIVRVSHVQVTLDEDSVLKETSSGICFPLSNVTGVPKGANTHKENLKLIKVPDSVRSVVVQNPNVIKSPVKQKITQVCPQVLRNQLVTVPVSSGIRMPPPRYHVVNSSIGLVSAPPPVPGNFQIPVPLAGNANSACLISPTVPFGGNANNARLISPVKVEVVDIAKRQNTNLAPVPRTFQASSIGGTTPLPFCVKPQSMISIGSRNILVSPNVLNNTSSIRMTNPNFQMLPRSPPPKYRCPMPKGVLVKKDLKNLAPKICVGSQSAPLFPGVSRPASQVVTMVTTASNGKPNTS